MSVDGVDQNLWKLQRAKIWRSRKFSTRSFWHFNSKEQFALNLSRDKLILPPFLEFSYAEGHYTHHASSANLKFSIVLLLIQSEHAMRSFVFWLRSWPPCKTAYKTKGKMTNHRFQILSALKSADKELHYTLISFRSKGFSSRQHRS